MSLPPLPPSPAKVLNLRAETLNSGLRDQGMHGWSVGGLKRPRRRRVSAWEERILRSQARLWEKLLALKVFWDEGRYGPLSLWAHGHVRSSGRSSDEGDGGDLVMVLLQDLAVEMNGEQLWSRAHANQMPADVVMGTDCYF